MLHMICQYTEEDRHHMNHFAEMIRKYKQCDLDSIRDLFFEIAHYQDVIKSEDLLEKSNYTPLIYNYLYSINFEINPQMLHGKTPPKIWYSFTPQEYGLLSALKNTIDVNPVYSQHIVERYIPIVKSAPKLDILEAQYKILFSITEDYHRLNKRLVEMLDHGYFDNEAEHPFFKQIQIATQLSIPLTGTSVSELVEEIPLCIES